MIRRNWRSASSIPAAVQRRAISPDCQRLTFLLVRRTHSIIDSIGLVEASVRASGPLIPRRVRVSVSAIPSRREAAARGAAMAAMQRSEGERKRSHRVSVLLTGAQGPDGRTAAAAV